MAEDPLETQLLQGALGFRGALDVPEEPLELEDLSLEEENLTLDESSHPETRGSFADRLIDDLLPEDVDWRNLVCTYPVSALSLAAIGGFLLARHKGLAMLGALSGFVADEVTDQIASFRGDG